MEFNARSRVKVNTRIVTSAKVIMFTDQVKSTPGTISRSHAEVAAVKREQERLTVVSARLCQGTILKDTGDGHILQFLSCREAVLCGSLLQQYVRERNSAEANESLKFDLHVGIDFGDVVVMQNDDISGEAANRAARVCSKCPPGEVYFTDTVASMLKDGEATVTKVGRPTLKGIGKVTLYRLAEIRISTDPPMNPFIWRNGITDGDDFFGRGNELKDLKAYLAGSQNQNCQIVGSRRIGKSSLLLHVQREASNWLDSLVPVYIDLQDARCETLEGFLGMICAGFGWSSPVHSMAEATECLQGMLHESKRPVLCLDEFERLVKNSKKFHPDFLLHLRACGQMGLSIVTGSKRPLHELIPGTHETSPFFNAFAYLPLGTFADGEAEDFVNYFRPGVERFSGEEKEAILSFSRKHPQAIQVSCFHVLNAKRNEEPLENAFKRAKQDMENHLPGEW